ncbi:hypothetical protein Halha_1671 [Halobacteroides halobius DSM 5150]|uniref:Uncharacterized protein n=1 Tax=Halobacteroides halobius (strain ATCC 35273 / DSM 5150 / MD-1) TaxID=748449 RepID=L0KBZ2_HALHC|nr:hypothetical protein [Halobacteroides halobius]AGB41608.1 hypothetical protein Halha_1671 [Halobacteroides halobius DSM 5150]
MLNRLFNFLDNVVKEGSRIDSNVKEAKESYEEKNHMFFGN